MLLERNSPYLAVLLHFSITCELCSWRRIIQNACYTAVNHTAYLSEETSVLLHRVPKVMFLSCDWWISIHFVCFCFKMTISIMIDGSIVSLNQTSVLTQKAHQFIDSWPHITNPKCIIIYSIQVDKWCFPHTLVQKHLKNLNKFSSVPVGVPGNPRGRPLREAAGWWIISIPLTAPSQKH